MLPGVGEHLNRRIRGSLCVRPGDAYARVSISRANDEETRLKKSTTLF